MLVCGACQRTLTRHSTDIIQSPACKSHFTTSHAIVPERNDARLTGVAALATGYVAQQTISTSKEGDEKDSSEEGDSSDNEDGAVFDDVSIIEEDEKVAAVPDDVSSNKDKKKIDAVNEEEEVDEDDVSRDNDDTVAIDNAFFCHHDASDEQEVIAVEEQDAISSDNEEEEAEDERKEIRKREPDTGVMELYHLLVTSLRSNPLELAQSILVRRCTDDKGKDNLEPFNEEVQYERGNPEGEVIASPLF